MVALAERVVTGAVACGNRRGRLCPTLRSQESVHACAVNMQVAHGSAELFCAFILTCFVRTAAALAMPAREAHGDIRARANAAMLQGIVVGRILGLPDRDHQGMKFTGLT